MTNKDKARAYHTAVSEYDPSTIVKMVEKNYIQHNPFVPSGRDAFVSLLPKLKEHGSKIENVRMLQDGAYVVMHHVWKNAIPFGEDEMVAFHIIRFDHEGLIAEHWNVMTENTPPNPSGRSLVDGEIEINDLDKTEANKARVIELFSLWTKRGREELKSILPRYFNADYLQHNPVVADGMEGYLEALQSENLDIVYSRQNKVFGEGNFVLSVSEGTYNGNPAACYDLFRLKNGMIAEHWNVYQSIPTEGLANQNTMFGF